MKKPFKRLLAAITACAAGAAAVLIIQGSAYDGNVSVQLNGQELVFAQAPIIQNDTTLVPMRTIFEALGMDVSWNEGNSSVTAVKNGKSVFVTVGSKSAEINGQAVELAEAPVILNGTTLVPLRVISEAMGVDVQWDEENYRVILTDEDKPADDSWKELTGNIDLTAMTVSGPGLSVSGKTVTVSGPGDFTVTGTNGDAMIKVAADGRVKLRLKGVDLTNTDGPAIFFEDCDKGYITVSKNTENRLADGAQYSVDAKGTVFSNDDLEIQGGGSLTVISNYNHAIVSDDKLKIEEGSLSLTAAGDGLHANDGIEISGGSISITAKGDGIQSEGYVDVTGGSVDITTTGQVAPSSGGFEGWGGFGGRGGRQGRGNLQTADGQQQPQLPDGQQFRQPDGQPPMGEQPPTNGQLPMDGQPQQDRQPVQTADAQQAEETDYPSTKGIKAETNLLIRGGSLNVNSADHCLHSAGIIYVNGGTMELASQAGKGMSAHAGLNIDGGNINVTKSTEGLESKGRFVINGGSVSVTASDDGLNAGGTNGRDAAPGSGHDLYINGGFIFVDAAGDGLDANGALYMCGGTAVVNGPTNSGNGALDSGGSIVARGGTLVASGSSGMAEYPRGQECTQNTVAYSLQSVAAGDILRIEDADGNEVLTYTSSKPYQNIVFSSPLLERGKEYRIYTGGSYEGGSSAGGIMTGGSYSGGTLAETFTADDTTTVIGGGQGFGGWGGFGGHGGGRFGM